MFVARFMTGVVLILIQCQRSFDVLWWQDRCILICSALIDMADVSVSFRMLRPF